MNIFFCGYNLFSSIHKARLTNTKLLYLKIQIGIEIKAAFLLSDKQSCICVDITDSMTFFFRLRLLVILMRDYCLVKENFDHCTKNRKYVERKSLMVNNV